MTFLYCTAVSRLLGGWCRGSPEHCFDRLLFGVKVWYTGQVTKLKECSNHLVFSPHAWSSGTENRRFQSKQKSLTLIYRQKPTLIL